jgi:hypothetical protein
VGIDAEQQQDDTDDEDGEGQGTIHGDDGLEDLVL